MKYSYSMAQIENDGEIVWAAQSKELRNCYGVGDTQQEALEELADNEQAWLEMAEENGFPIPKPHIEKACTYSGKLTLRLSPKEHELAAGQAELQGISLNQYISDAVVAYSHESVNNATELLEIHQKVSRIDEKVSMRIWSLPYYPVTPSESSYSFTGAKKTHELSIPVC